MTAAVIQSVRKGISVKTTSAWTRELKGKNYVRVVQRALIVILAVACSMVTVLKSVRLLVFIIIVVQTAFI